MKKLFALFVLAIIAGGLFGAVSAAHAENIVDVNFPCPGGDIPGFPTCERTPDGTATNDFVGYVLQAYQFGIGIVGIIAVGMIVYGGILIAWNTESIDKKGKGREMITSALTGIAVLFGSYLLLNTINPELVKFNLITNIPPQCSDGRDNDGDGKKDYPNDPDCSSAEDTTEKPDSGAISDALSSLQTFCGTNGDPATISRLDGEAPGVNGCEYRKMIYNGTSFKVGQNDDYYGEWFADTISAGTTIWSYPYFIKDRGTSTAKCLIYAYKKGSSSIEKIDLDSSLTICSLNPELKQKNSTSGTGGISDEEARNRLTAAGIKINKANCSDVYTSTNCTSLDGAPGSVVSFLERLGNACQSAKDNPIRVPVGNGEVAVINGCSPIVTGGTEVAPHPMKSHGPGKAVFDLRSTGNGDEGVGYWLKADASVTKICTSDAQSKFRKNCTTVEGNDHFHVEL